MSPVVLLALVVFAVATLGGLTLAAVRGWGAWRAFRVFRRVTMPALATTAAKLAGIEARTAAASAQAARLEQARSRLEESVATASVLAGAAGEILSFLRVIRSVVPEK
jgi:hypothetical protein